MSSAFPRAIGCVGSLPSTRHPISAARAVFLAAVSGPNDFGLQPPMQVVGRAAKHYAEKAAERVRVALLRSVHADATMYAPEWARYASISPPDPLELAVEDELSTASSRAVRRKYLRQIAQRMGQCAGHDASEQAYHREALAVPVGHAPRSVGVTVPQHHHDDGPSRARKRQREGTPLTRPHSMKMTTVLLPPSKRRRIDTHVDASPASARSTREPRVARAAGGDHDGADSEDDASASASSSSSLSTPPPPPLSPEGNHHPATTTSGGSTAPSPRVPCGVAEDNDMDDDVEDDVINDTVGVTVADRHGNVSAGVSSGGMILKHAGRTGSGGIPGAGCWAEKRSLPGLEWAVGCTGSGRGEHLIAGDVARSVARSLHSEATIRRLHASMSAIAWEQADAGQGSLEAGVSAIAVQPHKMGTRSRSRCEGDTKRSMAPSCSSSPPTTTCGQRTVPEACLQRPRARIARGSLVTSIGLGNICLHGIAGTEPTCFTVRMGTCFTTRHFAVGAAVDTDAISPDMRQSLCDQSMPQAIRWTEDSDARMVSCAGVLKQEDVLRAIRPS